jgi:tRNA pseudouridine-54 N-methylase
MSHTVPKTLLGLVESGRSDTNSQPGVVVSEDELEDVIDMAETLVHLIDDGDIEGVDAGEVGACEDVGVAPEQLDSLTNLKIEKEKRVN